MRSQGPEGRRYSPKNQIEDNAVTGDKINEGENVIVIDQF